MLLEVTPQTGNKERDGKGGKDLASLMSSLNTLSINEPPLKAVTQLEYEISRVSLSDDRDTDKAEEEVETSKEQVSQANPEHITIDDEKKSNNKEEKPRDSDKIDQPESKEEETEKDEKEKACDEKDALKKESSSQDVEKTDKAVSNSREEKEEEKEESKEGKKEETSKKDVSDSDNESSSDDTTPNESAPVAKEKKSSKLLRRGIGAGTQSDQHYSYPMYQPDYMSYQCEQPGVAPISYGPQLTMSPLQAMSPGYSNMPVSPVPGYTEPMYMQNGDGYFDNTMNSFLGSPGMGIDPYWIPDTPPSPIRDDNDLLGLTSTESSSFGHSPGDVLEAISRVESQPTGSVDPEKLIPITNQLFAELDGIQSVPLDISSLISGSNIDSQVDSELNNNLRPCLTDFPNILSPPAEDEIAEKSAEEEIQNHLDEGERRKATRRMAIITNEELTAKDPDGDNPCVVVACKEENSLRYYENLVAMVERARAIDICCEKPVSREKRCVVCGNTNQSTFYSPFAMRNNEGDTLLSSVIRAQQPELVINYICENIHRQADISIIFGDQNAEFYHYLMPRYPILSRFLNTGMFSPNQETGYNVLGLQ